MWIVSLALRRPYTFIVLALVLLILSPIVILRTPTDIFPDIDIPVISIVWKYEGLSPQEMSNRITTITERALTTLVNDIDHIQSDSLDGIAVVKVFFRPNANIQTALAQVTAIS
ncbi:MAG TPA: efflux RND transporter permease subunit, partial [Terriglobales bacterium]